MIVYDEDNTQFSVTVENTLSKEYILLNISSTFEPKCNEIWIRNAQDNSKFWLVQAIQQKVKYYIKHSGEFLYKVSNEEDLFNFKVTKIRLPS